LKTYLFVRTRVGSASDSYFEGALNKFLNEWMKRQAEKRLSTYWSFSETWHLASLDDRFSIINPQEFERLNQGYGKGLP